MIDASVLQLLLAGLAGWLNRRECEVIGYLVAENRLLRRQLDGQRLRLTDDDRRRLAVRAYRLGRRQGEAGIRMVQTPYQAPNANAYAERFVRSSKQVCLDRMIPIGECHFQGAVREFVEHYHRERNHQGLQNALIAGTPVSGAVGRVHRRPRLGGLLNYYKRAA